MHHHCHCRGSDNERCNSIQSHKGFQKELNVLSNKPWSALLSESVILIYHCHINSGLTPQWLSTLKSFWPSFSGYQARHQSYISITQARLTEKTFRPWPTDQFNPTVSKHNPQKTNGFVSTTFVVMWQELINFCNYLEATKDNKHKTKTFTDILSC